MKRYNNSSKFQKLLISLISDINRNKSINFTKRLKEIKVQYTKE